MSPMSNVLFVSLVLKVKNATVTFNTYVKLSYMFFLHVWYTSRRLRMYRFDIESSLARIAATSAADIGAMRKQARAGKIMIDLYDARLPPVIITESSTITPHSPSISLLQQYNSWLLTRYVPVSVGGDSNCFIRSRRATSVW